MSFVPEPMVNRQIGRSTSQVVIADDDTSYHPTIYVTKRPRGRPRKHYAPGEPIIIYVPDQSSAGQKRTEERKELNVEVIQLDEMQQTHYKLEVLEHRIQIGDDPDHDHPAMSIAIFKSNQAIKNWTYKERKLKSHYGVETVTEQRPLFWEQRPWDSKDMKQDESEKLGGKIKSIIEQCQRIRPKELSRRQSKKRVRYFTESDETDEYDSERSESNSPSRRTQRTTHVATRSSGTSGDRWGEKPVSVKLWSQVFATDESDGTDMAEF